MERVVGRSSAGLGGDFGGFDSAGAADFDEGWGWGGLRGGGEGGGFGWAEEHLSAVIHVFARTHESFPNKIAPTPSFSYLSTYSLAILPLSAQSVTSSGSTIPTNPLVVPSSILNECKSRLFTPIEVGD